MRKLWVSLAVAVAVATSPVIANAGNILSKDDLDGSIIFTYAGGFDSSNVVNVEITDAPFTSAGPLSALVRPDYFNYGFNLNIDGLALNWGGSLTTVAKDALDPEDVAGVEASWTIDYYGNEGGGSIGDGGRPRTHTILFGSVVDLVLSTLPDGSLRTFGHLKIDDGIYHSVNNPNGDLTNLSQADIDAIMFFTGVDVTGVDLTVFEYESIYDFDYNDQDPGDGFLLGGALSNFDANTGSGRIEFQSTSGYLATVPEPGTFAIFGLGLVGLGLMRRRKRVAA